jgi:hypothetical protein
MEAVFFDLEGDGDQDLYVVSGSNEFPEGSPLLENRVYLNDGKGVITRNRNAVPDGLRINGQCVEPFDPDQDGDTDLFIGGRMVAGAYPIPASSAILINEKGVLRDRTSTIAPSLKNIGLVTDAIGDDVDGDGDTDLLIAGEWMAPVVLINQDGRFESRRLDPPGVGIWWTIEKGDFDKDGDNDFVLGNLGWNQKFGGEHPKLSVYTADFDNSGDYDVVLAKQIGDRELPYRGRECSSEEMPFIAEKFLTYDAFAKARLGDILGTDRLEHSTHITINTLTSIYLRNDGGMRFQVSMLPDQVQTGPVKAICVMDFNGDGDLDFIYAGNHLPVEVETARYDGLLHGICFGDGSGGFIQRTFSSDFWASVDYRDVTVVSNRGSGVTLVFAINDLPAMIYNCNIPFQ